MRGVLSGTALSILILSGCASAPRTAPAPRPAPSPAPVPPPAPAPPAAGPVASRGLPPIPAVDGPLAIHVVYPPAGHLLTAHDSTFILGSVGSGLAGLTINGAEVAVQPNGAFLGWLPVPTTTPPRYDLVAHKGADTVRTTVALAARPVASGPPAPPDTVRPLHRRAELLNMNEAAHSDTDQVTIARPVPGGTYKWFLLPGTILDVTGARRGSYRVRLDDHLDVWIDERGVRLLSDSPESTTAQPQLTGNARVTASHGYSDLRIPISERPAYALRQQADDLELTLYGVTANTDLVTLTTADSSIRDVIWEQVATHRARFTMRLRHAPYGYLVLWDHGTFVVRVRRPPAVDSGRPLNGRVIAVDPGHPPIGATGPTGLYEADAVLAVAQRLRPMLEAAGATVVMTRTTRDPVALGDRPIIARRADADAFVSIHLNALPDGINPFTSHGTGTYFFFEQSEPLARAVQRGMVREMGLRDLGIHYDNLAVVRQSWMPAVLCEGAFVILPDQEAALRTPEFQERYARGILDGLEEFFRQLVPAGAPR